MFLLMIVSCSPEELTIEDKANELNLSPDTFFKTSSRELANEDVSEIRSLNFKGTDIFTHEVILVSEINEFSSIIYTEKASSSFDFVRFVKMDQGVKHLFDRDGFYDYSIKYDEDSKMIVYKDSSYTAKSGNCYEGCMEDAEYNWMADSDGNPTDGIVRAINEITWRTNGEVLAIGWCGTCCSGLWDCPERVGSSEEVIENPGLFVDIFPENNKLIIPTIKN